MNISKTIWDWIQKQTFHGWKYHVIVIFNVIEYIGKTRIMKNPFTKISWLKVIMQPRDWMKAFSRPFIFHLNELNYPSWIFKVFYLLIQTVLLNMNSVSA